MVILSGVPSDLVNTKESILPVCDKPYHTVKENLPQWVELEHLWNYALLFMDKIDIISQVKTNPNERHQNITGHFYIKI